MILIYDTDLFENPILSDKDVYMDNNFTKYVGWIKIAEN